MGTGGIVSGEYSEPTNWSNEQVVIRGIWWGYNGNDEDINDGDKNGKDNI